MTRQTTHARMGDKTFATAFVGEGRADVVNDGVVPIVLAYAPYGYTPAVMRLCRKLVKHYYKDAREVYLVEWLDEYDGWQFVWTRHRDSAYADLEHQALQGRICHVTLWDMVTGERTVVASTEDTYRLTCNEPDPVLSSPE